MTTSVDLRIDIAALVDKYVERPGDFEFGMADAEYPQLWSLIDSDGQKWLTDRYWMLPESACDLSRGEFPDALPMTEPATSKGREWLAALRVGELAPTQHRFAPTFGGVLTLAGLHASAITGQPLIHALTKSGERIGVLMPLLEPTKASVPIPISIACLGMYKRIAAAEVVDPWQAWDLAAHLTNT